MNYPSIKTIGDRLSVSPATAKKIRRIIDGTSGVGEGYEFHRCHPSHGIAAKLNAISDLIEGFGEEVSLGLKAGTSFRFVNMGDSYVCTVVRFDSGRWAITDWGSIVERDGDNYP